MLMGICRASGAWIYSLLVCRGFRPGLLTIAPPALNSGPYSTATSWPQNIISVDASQVDSAWGGCSKCTLQDSVECGTGAPASGRLCIC